MVFIILLLYAVTQVHTTQLHRVEMDKPTEAPLEQLEDEDNNNSTGVLTSVIAQPIPVLHA